MSADSNEPTPKMTRERILNFVRTHDEPCVTAGEVAAEFGVTNGAANYRLKQLRDEGELQDKRVGASAKIWYLVG